MSRLRLVTRLAFFTALLVATSASAVSIDWVTVGNPGNACDTQSQGCFGAVAYTYRISKYEVTNAQYAEFLNAKAASDPWGLYNTSMAVTYGGITRGGTPGSYAYSAVAGRENKPVNFVSFYDSLRFTNWLNNGQGSGDTETGAYTLLGGTRFPSNGETVTRNASASIFLTSEDEWYKAAYYDAVSTNYDPFPFADGSTGPVCQIPAGTTSHSANCSNAVNNTTDVGAYTTAPSASGTFDQGGNVWEWNEAIESVSNRVYRGGNWNYSVGHLAASVRLSDHPTNENDSLGFRVAMIPEPGTGLLLGLGLAGLAAGQRRRDAARSLW
ncbi:formylglycine-generating enzyme family protein [bacterium]|nr:formylglycine-generating enzyme family protein [bacterium]MDB4433113.1 formylglycine-generating enzyme family protein [bacterium]